MDDRNHMRALELMGSNVVLDTHSHFLLAGYYLNKRFARRHRPPWLWNPLRNVIDLPRLREGRVSCAAFSIYVPPPPLRLSAWKACNRILDALDRLVEKQPEEVVKTDSARDIRSATDRGLLAALPAVEGGHVIGRKVERVGTLRERGVRLMTLTHFYSNRICDAHKWPYVHKGLSAFGREVLQACQAHGVVTDLAHCSDLALDQILDVLEKPPMITHTALRNGRSSQRFVTPDQLKRVAERGGAAGVILWPWYLKSGSVFGGLDLVADMYARMADLVGPEHLMLGSDMDGFTWLPRGMREVSDLPALISALLDKGFTGEDLVKILGGNALRILSAWESGSPTR